MQELLIESPLLLLFCVAAIGYMVGSISYKGNSLGVSAVLFVGLFFGAMNQNFKAPDVLFELGLVFFVYSIGLSSGAAFFKSIRKNGMRDISFVIIMLTSSAIFAVGLAYLFTLGAASTVGIYAGSTTNTPALAGVIDLINQNFKGTDASVLNEQAVVAYSFTYPMGVLGGMIAIVLMEKIFRIDYKKEKKQLRNKYPTEEDITSVTIRVTNPEVVGKKLREINQHGDWSVIFGRVMNTNFDVSLPSWDMKLKMGYQIMVIGTEEDIEAITEYLGQKMEFNISYDRKEYEVRRIFVSNPSLVGRSISSLNLAEKYDAVITRIRRGDTDMLAKPSTVLEAGDRIRFVAKRRDLQDLSEYIGDSYYQSSKVNLFSVGLGIAMGLLLGMIEFTLPGNITFKLGFAGGPLIVGLLLGALYRTGPIVWILPYSANVTLRQMGLILLLAVIGIRSGSSFISSFNFEVGLILFVAGTLLSLATAVFAITMGLKLFKIPFSVLTGFISNQPAILDFAMERSGNRIPMIGYTLVFPIALVLKIVYAQLIFLFLS